PCKCRLTLYDGRGRYEVLLYDGVPEEATSSIELLSTASTMTLNIRPNLEAALRQLRYPDRYRLLWIDSICINPNHLAERNAHIQRMRSIFNTASKVCVWLGVASPEGRLAFDFIHKLAE